jgi:hypothetical protein
MAISDKLHDTNPTIFTHKGGENLPNKMILRVKFNTFQGHPSPTQAKPYQGGITMT